MISNMDCTRLVCLTTILAIGVTNGCGQESGRSAKRGNAVEIDLGTILVKDTVNTQVKFDSPLSETFRVVQIRTSCTCSVIGDIPKRIASTESVSIPLELNLSRFAARTTDKPFPLEFRLLLLGQDSNIVVNIRALLQSPIQCDDPVIDVGERLLSEARQQVFTKTFLLQDQNLDVELDYDKSKLNVELRRNSSGKCEMTVGLKESATSGHFEEQVRLICWNGNDIVSEFPITVTGNLLPEFYTNPDCLDFGVCKKSTNVTGDVMCQSRSGLDFRIENAAWSSGNKTDIETEKTDVAAGAFRIRISACPRETGLFDDSVELTIRQSTGEQSLIVVPVRAYVSDAGSPASPMDVTKSLSCLIQESPFGR